MLICTAPPGLQRSRPADHVLGKQLSYFTTVLDLTNSSSRPAPPGPPMVRLYPDACAPPCTVPCALAPRDHPLPPCHGDLPVKGPPMPSGPGFGLPSGRQDGRSSSRGVACRRSSRTSPPFPWRSRSRMALMASVALPRPEALTASVIQLAAAQLAVCPTDTSAAPTALSRSRAPKGGTATTAQVRIPLRSLSE